MRRREFLSGAAAAWPVASKAQQAERVRRVGMLNILGPDDPEAHARRAVFEQALQQLGWAVGRDLTIETREVGADLDSLRRYVAELVALAPDVIFSIGSVPTSSLQQATRTIPIVFMNVTDPVGAGIVESMAHPGGNMTGFSNFEYSMSGKWAELLKQIAPHLSRALVFRDPTSAVGIGQFSVVRSVAQSLGVELTPVNVHDRRNRACRGGVRTFRQWRRDRNDRGHGGSSQAHHQSRRSLQIAVGLSLSLLHRRWWPDLVRTKYARSGSACGGGMSIAS